MRYLSTRLAAALLGVLMVASSCATSGDDSTEQITPEGLDQLADDLNLDAYQCALDNGIEVEFTEDGGIFTPGPPADGDRVAQCVDDLLATPKYALFLGESEELQRITYDRLIDLYECIVDSEVTIAQRLPPFETWLLEGRVWNPLQEWIETGDDATIDQIRQTCPDS